MADFVCKQGDAGQVFTATMVDASGAAINLTGGSVSFVARAQTAINTAVNASATIVSPTLGQVSYTLQPADTAVAGPYMVEWHYTTAAGVKGTWPVDGWQEWTVEENLTTAGGARIVGLGEVKDHLRIDATDRSHDHRLLQMIDELTPVVEGITGPVVQRIISETYDGGTWFIALRRRPVLEVHEVTEYRGPLPYRLTQVPTPDLGSIYSYMFEPPGRIVRRTAGGGITTFPPGADQVFVTYTAGYARTPPNIRGGVLEIVRMNYDLTEQGRLGPAGGDPADNFQAAHMSFYISPRVQQMLARSRRHPSVA